MQTDADNASSKHVSRRGFVVISGIASLAAGVAASPATAQSETDGRILAQPMASPTSDENTSDILVEAVIDWGATHVFGIVGDGINPIVEALRKRQDRIAFVGVRHGESAAFVATAFAKHTVEARKLRGPTASAYLAKSICPIAVPYSGLPSSRCSNLTLMKRPRPQTRKRSEHPARMRPQTSEKQMSVIVGPHHFEHLGMSAAC